MSGKGTQFSYLDFHLDPNPWPSTHSTGNESIVISRYKGQKLTLCPLFSVVLGYHKKSSLLFHVGFAFSDLHPSALHPTPESCLPTVPSGTHSLSPLRGSRCFYEESGTAFQLHEPCSLCLSCSTLRGEHSNYVREGCG